MISSFQLLENDNSNNAMNSISEKDYSKYINLTKDEIVQKINEKNKEIINYHNINKSLKTELKGILEKLNSFTKKNFLHFKSLLADAISTKPVAIHLFISYHVTGSVKIIPLSIDLLPAVFCIPSS